jgi:hypothetical protein
MTTMIEYDELGLFTLVTDLQPQVAGGYPNYIHVRVGPFVSVRGNQPVPRREVARVPGALDMYADVGCIATNLLCTEGTDGVNPVCFTNVGC